MTITDADKTSSYVHVTVCCHHSDFKATRALWFFSLATAVTHTCKHTYIEAFEEKQTVTGGLQSAGTPA